MSEKSPWIYKFLLMVLPVGVVVGTIVFMVMYFYLEREEEREHAVIASYGMRWDDLDDMVGKFSDRIGPRGVTTETGRHGLKRAASMIEGRLGPQNVGYPVKKGPGISMDGLVWKSLWVDLTGGVEPEKVVFAAVSFAGPGEVADANSISTLMMLASSMAREKPGKTIRFTFLPMDLTPDEQNRWLLQKCLLEGETCAGIIGLQSMQGEPSAGGGDWEVVAPRVVDQRWWAYVSQGEGAPTNNYGSVWVSGSIFSSLAWMDRRKDRLNRTIQEAREIEGWLRQAAK